MRPRHEPLLIAALIVAVVAGAALAVWGWLR